MEVSIENRKTPSGKIKPCLGFPCPFNPREDQIAVFYKGHQLPFREYTIKLNMLDYGPAKTGGDNCYWFGIATRFRLTHWWGWKDLKNWTVKTKTSP